MRRFGSKIEFWGFSIPLGIENPQNHFFIKNDAIDSFRRNAPPRAPDCPRTNASFIQNNQLAPTCGNANLTCNYYVKPAFTPKPWNDHKSTAVILTVGLCFKYGTKSWFCRQAFLAEIRGCAWNSAKNDICRAGMMDTGAGVWGGWGGGMSHTGVHIGQIHRPGSPPRYPGRSWFYVSIC